MIFVFLCLTDLVLSSPGPPMLLERNGIISFFLKTEDIPLYICTTASLFIPLLMDKILMYITGRKINQGLSVDLNPESGKWPGL